MNRIRIAVEKAKSNYSAYSPDLPGCVATGVTRAEADRKSTRLNSSHCQISYAVFCLKNESALFEAVFLDEIGLVLLDEPAVLPCHLEKLSARVRRSQSDLDADNVQFLGEAAGVVDAL